MKTRFIDEEFKYDGSQLQSLYAYLNYGILGDSIISWCGPCDISFDKMIDGEDLLQKATIAGDEMLHFIIEVFERDLFSAVALQRLMAGQIKDILQQRIVVNKEIKTISTFRRDGDDIYYGDGKLSISIASRSPVSVMVHFAMNVTNSGTPVKTASLEDMFIKDPKDLANEIMKKVSFEYQEILSATRKVRPLS